jgi:hypothetical protein
MTVDEFICPLKREGHWTSKVTTEYCEAMIKNKGCSQIPLCLEYKEQKALEMTHPEIDWRHIWKHKEEELSIINLIKKGCIILPEQIEITNLSQEKQ